MKLKPSLFLLILFIYHLVFSWVAYDFVLRNNGDAFRYWFVGKDLSSVSWFDYLKPGTDIIQFFTFPLVKYLHLPFWIGYLMFSVLSFVGVWILYQIMAKIAGKSFVLKCLMMVLLLLPNLHFWTSNIGKEAFLLVPLVLVLWEIFHKRYCSFLLIISIVAVALIRPHVAFVLLCSYVLSLFLTVKMTNHKKLMIGGVFFSATGIFVFLLTQLQDFSGGVQRIIHKYNVHIHHFQKTDAYVPLDEYPLPLKIFTFYFRPLPFEKEGLFYQIISIENAILLLLSIFGFYFAVKYFGTLRKQILFVFPLVMLFLFALMYVYAYANYGIIMRTRIMVTPFLYLLFLKIMAIAFLQKPTSTIQSNTP